MKNNNLTKIAKGLLATALLTTLVACGKKADNNNQNLNAFTLGCVANCEGITGFPFFAAQTQAYKMNYYGYGYTNAMSLNLSFSGQNINSQAQGQGQNNNQYASPAMNYVGKVSAAGQVNVAAILNLGFCPAVPAGQYNLVTQTAGQWANGAISGLRMVIQGPVTMTAVINQAQASEYGYQYSSSSRVTGQIVIEQVNGYFCQGATLYLN
ncbi:MAG: hypothetical protein ABL930_07880 [Pseudobdellovibrio sp.]